MINDLGPPAHPCGLIFGVIIAETVVGKIILNIFSAKTQRYKGRKVLLLGVVLAILCLSVEIGRCSTSICPLQNNSRNRPIIGIFCR